MVVSYVIGTEVLIVSNTIDYFCLGFEMVLNGIEIDGVEVGCVRDE